MNEAEITINGQPLSPAQAMAVRVALTDFHSSMSDPQALGNDDHGKRMVVACKERSGEVLKIIFGHR